MKNILKYRLTLIGLLVSLVTISFSSCSDDKSYDIVGGPGKVYIRLQSSNMVNSIPNVMKAGISQSPIGVFGEVSVSFPIRSTMPAKRTIEVSLDMDNSLVSQFNTLHNTEYLSIDPNFVKIENSTLRLEKGEVESSEQIHINLDKDKTSNLALGDYLVPIKITQTNGGFEVSKEWNTMYVHIEVSENPWGIDLADRTGWSVKEVSSEEVTGEDGRAVLVLDGNNSTFWHTEWYYNSPKPPYNIVIDMGKKMKMFGFQYVSRNNYNGWPKEMTIETSLDGTTWEDAGLYSDLPSGAAKEYRSFFPNLEIKDARYFRLTITKTHGNTSFTAVAEINALAIE